ncbi:MAG TPA: adenylyltransferase/cytidyltransferase family protein [Candidatus Limenecus avicola]|uniref:Adenylyltransferase/cytidyltransferase family protein n=1 Tax=Candidatus Limenecus avicola TaxID=2840847 RepID=A0A9D1MZI3_9CLOT|nr:adenylyltransferase/cytidyltransferase family protein [Candidatus Limenecus avicola]
MSDKTKRVVGFTLGCFDLFHIGHINLLRNARALCDTLIVGVCSDEYMLNNKREPIYALNDRMEILKACKYCDVVVPEDTLEKVELYNKYKFDILFVGSDWYGDERYIIWEKQLKEIGVSVVYLPYTNEVSSSKIIQKIAQMRQIH